MAFYPKFVVSDSLWHTADLINRPHEDYPKRVTETHGTLENLMSPGFRPIQQCLEEADIRAIHRRIMWDLEPVSDRGEWRTCDVVVGASRPVSHLRVADEIRMLRLFPIGRASDCEGRPLVPAGHWYRRPWEWYRRFEEVHPFRDGNGRVGGIVLAWLTYDPGDGTMLAPLQ